MMVDIAPSPEWIWAAVVAGVSAILWQAGDRRYVRRKPYHDAIDTLTANTSKVQEDVNQLKTAVAVLTNSTVAMSSNIKDSAESSAKMAEMIGEIRIDVATLTATWKGAWSLKHGQYPEEVKSPG